MSAPMDAYTQIRINRYAAQDRQRRQVAWAEIDNLPTEQRVPARDAKLRMYLERQYHEVTMQNQEERDHVRDIVEGRITPTRAEAVRLTKNLIIHLTTIPAVGDSPARTKSFPPQGLTQVQLLRNAGRMVELSQVDGPGYYTVLDEQAITQLVSELRKGGWRNNYPGKPYLAKNMKTSSHVLVGNLREDCPEGEDARRKRLAKEKSERRIGNMESVTTPFVFIQDNIARMKGAEVKMVMTARDLLPVFELKTADNCHTARQLVDFNVDLSESMLEMIMARDEAVSIRASSINMSKLVHSIRWDIWMNEGHGVINDPNRMHTPVPLSSNTNLFYSIALNFGRPVFLCNVFNDHAFRLRTAVDSLDYNPENKVDANADRRARWSAGAREWLA